MKKLGGELRPISLLPASNLHSSLTGNIETTIIVDRSPAAKQILVL